MSGTGTIDNPFDLATALNSYLIEPGDTIYLRAGTYAGDFSCSLQGNAGNPITIRPYQNEIVKMDGNFTFSAGGYITVRDLEFLYSGWTTRDEADVAGQNALNRVTASVPGVKFINNIIHDMRLGIYSGIEGLGVELYGNVIYYNGYSGATRGHGHSLYLNNNVATSKIIKHNIMFSSFAYGIHMYAESVGYLTDFEVVENTIFESGILATGSTPRANILLGGYDITANDSVLTRNYAFHSGAANQNQLGYNPGSANNIVMDGNYLPDGLSKINATNITETGNYYGTEIGNQIFLHLNAYNANRANLTIYNEAEANTVSVDISSLGWTGQVAARNVQDYFVDIQTLDIVDGSITVNMQAINRTVATPIGWTAPARTFPTFGAFVLEKT